jgi:hypothetical protein
MLMVQEEWNTIVVLADVRSLHLNQTGILWNTLVLDLFSQNQENKKKFARPLPKSRHMSAPGTFCQF